MAPGLLDSVLHATAEELDRARSRLDAFLGTVDAWRALAIWLAPEPDAPRPGRLEVLERLTLDVAAIDRRIASQVNAVLHHPAVQRLEATWRGVAYLTEQVGAGDNIRVRLLDLSWRELSRDLERAIEFDQSQLFKKVYSAEFGSPGGEPFGVLLGDYYVSHRPRPDQPTDDVRVLRAAAQVAAAAFAPLIVGAHPGLFGVDDLEVLGRQVDLHRIFRQKEYVAWNALRELEDARFLGVALPRILMRRPYEHSPARVDGFPFREDTTGEHRTGYLWGNACFAFGAVLVRTFQECSWLAGIRGVERGTEGGGLVDDLAQDEFATDAPGIALKPVTELLITDAQEKAYSDLGLIPLCYAPGTPYAVFYGTQSLQRPKRFDSEEAAINAKLSAMLQYILCVSRFAHYVKVMCRDLAGTYSTAAEIQKFLNAWLRRYATSTEEDSSERQAEFPLREANVTVRELPGRPGVFTSTIHLRPHFQLDQMTSTVKLVTEVVNNA